MHYAGSKEGPEGEVAPNITPDQETGIGDWNGKNIEWLLETGMKPDADNVQGLMAEAIESGYSHLPPEDLQAIAEYLFSLSPIQNYLGSEANEMGKNW